jgi:hypothetical protein
MAVSQVDRLKNRPDARPGTTQAMMFITGSFVGDLSGVRGSRYYWTDRDGRIVSRGVLTIFGPWRLADTVPCPGKENSGPAMQLRLFAA